MEQWKNGIVEEKNENKTLLSDDKFADLCRLEIEALHPIVFSWPLMKNGKVVKRNRPG